MVSESSSASRTHRATVAWLALFIAAAVFLRIGFSLDSGFDEDTQRYMYTGNDPYYHDRTVHHILDTGEHLTFDPAINYPAGAYNPNPPIYDWSAVPLAAGLEKFSSVPDPVGLSLNVMVAVWGALTVIPVYVIAADLWGRRAGLWAGLLIAVSAPHIQRSVAGYADHDATTMFFITLAMAFMIKALRALDHRDYVTDWRHAEARRAGIRAAFAHNRTALLWSMLCGMALTATALTWKGYPYVIAVMALGLGLQLLSDHLRKKDSTALFVLYLVPLAMIALLPYLLFYRATPPFLDTTVWPSLYVVLAALLVGLILVPTRQLPSIVVFPALAVAALLGLAALYLFVPDTWTAIFTGLGYFKATKLYTTIAEAQRADLGLVAASFGFFTFLLAFWGFGKALKGAWKGAADLTLLVAWAGVGLFMAFKASRFIVNAAPVFAVLVAPTLVTIVSRLGLGEVRRRYAAQHGQNPVASAFRSLDTKAVLGGLLVAALLILPNVWIGVDAAIPADYEAEHKLDQQFFGAFGIGYELRDNGWMPVLADLAERDQGVPLEDRPAFIAWWDYGHWATSIGEHPTVADPFQHNFKLAGRFLSAESEAEAVSWLAIHLVNWDWSKDGPGYSPKVEQVLKSYAPNETLLALGPTAGFDNDYDLLFANVTGDEAFAFFEDVQDATGHEVGYFAADRRMYPISAENYGIFYAPAYLANKNPDDFIPITMNVGGRTLNVQQYETDGETVTKLADPRYVEGSGDNAKEWVAYNGYLYEKGRTPRQGYDPESGVNLGGVREDLQPTGRFAASMYSRAFGSYAAQVPAGDGLDHWRVISETTRSGGQIRDVVLLEYYSGVRVFGKVVDDDGEAMAGVAVGFRDGFGAMHGSALTEPDGTFETRAPFAEDGDLAFVVGSQGVDLFSDNGTRFQFTREQAREGASVSGLEVTVPRGGIRGTVFRDVDGQPGFNRSADAVLPGATVTLGTRTVQSDAGGNFTFAQVQAGSRPLTATLAGYLEASTTAAVAAGETTEVFLQMRYEPVGVNVTFRDFNGTGVAGVQVQVLDADGAPAAAPKATNATGVALFSLDPGAYTLSVNATVGATTYKAEQALAVAVGSDDFDVALTRDE